MSHAPQPAALGAVALVLALALAGCGGGRDEPGVASAATGHSTVTTAGARSSAVEEYVKGVRKFVACMRENGFNLPDPGPKGEIDYASVGDIRKLKGDPKFIAAQVKCRELMPPLPDELLPKENLTAEQIAHRREYAKCMRANGLPDWPDPNADGSWPEERGGTPEQVTEQEAAAQFRAGQICGPVLEGKPTSTPNPRATGVG